MKKNNIRKLVVAAMMLAIALLLPYLTGQIPEIGSMLCPMHLPVLLCGFLCGPWWGLAVGAVAAPLRFVLLGMPKAPTCFFMAAEMAVYGFLAGFLYKLFPKKIPFLYASLLLAMIGGRLVYGAVQWIAVGIGGGTYTLNAFLASAVIGSWPGILLQIILIPVLVIALKRAKILSEA
jgi:hypothetical protein epulo_06830